MRLLVTGGAGFVGSHLVHTLARGNDVVVVDDLSNGSLSNLKNARRKVKFLKTDISKPSVIGKLGRVDGIFHLACHPRSFSFDRPARDVEVNVKSTINMLELARKCNAKLIFTSNSGIYGEPKYLPIDENHSIDCKTPYDVNKYASELQIKAFERQFGVKAVVCRLATVYGPGQRVNEKVGWRPLIATFIERLATGKRPTIFGDGEQTRDLIYVKDVVDGLVNAFSSTAAEGDVFNLSTGVETSVNSVYHMLLDAFGKHVEPERGPSSVGDVRRMCYSNEKAKKAFGFTIEYPLDSALKDYVAWRTSQDANRNS